MFLLCRSTNTISAQGINVFLTAHRIFSQQKPTLTTNKYIGRSELPQFPLFLNKCLEGRCFIGKLWIKIILFFFLAFQDLTSCSSSMESYLDPQKQDTASRPWWPEPLKLIQYKWLAETLQHKVLRNCYSLL